MTRSRIALSIVAAWLAAAFATAALASDFAHPPLQGSEGVATGDGASGVVFNPALVGLRYPSEMIFGWTRDDAGHDIAYDAWGAWRGLGLRASRLPGLEQRLGTTLAGGSPTLRMGWSVEWAGPDLAPAKVVDHRVGLVARPSPWLSLGATTDHLFRENTPVGPATRMHTFGIAVRPAASRPAAAFLFGPRLTLRGDWVVPERPHPHIGWRWGIDAEVASGIAVRFSFDEDHRSQLGVALRLPTATFAANVAPRTRTPSVIASIPEWGILDTLRGPHRAAYTSYALSLHSGEEPTVLVPPGARRVATVEVSGDLGDESLGGISLLGGGAVSQRSVGAVSDQLTRALEDPLTRGVLIDLGGASNMAAIEELRPRIAALRAAGKPVVAMLEEGGGRADLSLATACTRVFTSEEALFAVLGLRSERRFYRSMLERFGLRIDRVSVGQYKSAYKNYSGDSTSVADREVINHLLDQLQGEFVTTLGKDRGLAPERFTHLLDGRAWPPEDLVRAGIIDSVGYREQALATLGRLAGLGPKPATRSLRSEPGARRAWSVPPGVAVVYASGDIESGESGNDLLGGPTLGSSTLVRQIERAFRAPDVHAVVFRIESGGGSVTASNVILHALERMRRETGKPLVVSMGFVAASGGYYIALPAQRIFADRATRTGSIGVVFVHPSLQPWYEKQGVREEDFDRGDYMAGGSGSRNWDERTRASADSAIGRSYDRFVDKVAASRRLTRDRALAIAQGRVWLGEEARSIGLVDEVGGLDDAIRYARRVAGLDPAARYEPREFRRPRPGLLQRLGGSWLREALSREAQLHDPAGVRFESDDDFAF